MLSILIVNWNTRDLLRACLQSIEAELGGSGMDFEVVVVDNASADGSAAMVAEEFPQVNLIASNENLGFAAGNNRAYSEAKGEMIWLLNPDTELLPGSGSSLVLCLQSIPKAGAVASALIDARDGSIQRSCRFGFYKMGWWNYLDRRKVEQPMASSLLLRREAIEAAGGLFDEAFPIFFNDVDLCRRLWDSGWEIWFEPASRVRHWGGAATRQVRPAMIAESHWSMRLYYEKHYRGKISPFTYWPTVWMFAAAGKFRVMRAKRAESGT